MDTFCLEFGYILFKIWIHFVWILDTFSSKFSHIFIEFWIHLDHLVTFLSEFKSIIGPLLCILPIPYCWQFGKKCLYLVEIWSNLVIHLPSWSEQTTVKFHENFPFKITQSFACLAQKRGLFQWLLGKA